MAKMIKKILLITLLSTTIAFGQYAAPNEDTVIVVGGLGTQGNAAQLNGGGATKVVWDAGSPSDFINTNGGPKRTASCAFTTASKNLNGTDIGNGITVGTLCYVSTGDGSHITAGIYEITTVTDNDNIVCAQIDDDGTNDTGVTVNVGGALDTLQNGLDEKANNAASYNRYIYYNIASVTLAAPIDIDAYGGSTTTEIIVQGWNATLAAKEQKTITTDSDIATLLNFNLGASIYISFHYFIFDAGGANKANYCAYGVDATDDYVVFTKCIFDDAEDQAAVLMNGDFWSVISCELKNSGAGFKCGGGDGSNSKILNCSIHDNTNDGIFIDYAGSRILNNLIYDNGGIGISINNQINHSLIGNTLYANDGDNISVTAGEGAYSNIVNNAAVGSTGGYGFNLNGNSPDILGFGYNLSAGNNSGHTDISGTFADLGIGSNIASAQAADDIFETITDGSEDFTPETGSDLIDNALDAGVN